MAPERNGESGESFKGMLTAKIKEITLEVVREEMDRCPFGIDHKNRIQTLEKDVSDMKGEIAKGFDKLDGRLEELFNSRYNDAKEKVGEAKEGQKDIQEKHRWSFEQIMVAILAIAAILAQIIFR